MSASPGAASDLSALAQQVVARCQALGAEEATAGLSTGSHVSLARRDRRVEEATEATTKRLGITLLVEGRYSSHSTSDLRPEAVERFLAQAVAATRFLEPDPDRALPPPERCGRGVSEAQLDALDPTWRRRTTDDRAAYAEALEEAVLARRTERFVSATVMSADGYSRGALATSHGFTDETCGAWFSATASVTQSDAEGRRPEGYASYATRYLSDLPSAERIAAEAVERAEEMVGSGPVASGKYTLVLPGRAAGRILGVLGGPLNGSALHFGRSCLAGKRGERIGSAAFTLRDDPSIPRGLASAPWDGDGMRAIPRPIITRGVLDDYYIDTYFGRKLGVPPTTGSPTNWVVEPGTRAWEEIAREHERAILITGFLGGNSNGLTGDFSFGIRGRLLERGEPSASLSEMNVSGNALDIFHRLAEVADDPWRYSSTISPTLVFTEIQFSGT